MITTTIKPWLLALTAAALPGVAAAHVSVTSRLQANAYSEVVLSVPHGCNGLDTQRVRVELPAGLSSIRPYNSLFGDAVVETDEQDSITAIVWTNNAAELYETDSHAYTLAFRAKTPDQPFRTLYFPTVQFCLDAGGNEITAEWTGAGDHHHGANTEQRPAPRALLYPPRAPGWNQYDVDEHLHDLSIFDDAEIVWSGDAAYSGNTRTRSLIEQDAEAVLLQQLHPGSVIWVKY